MCCRTLPNVAAYSIQEDADNLPLGLRRFEIDPDMTQPAEITIEHVLAALKPVPIMPVLSIPSVDAGLRLGETLLQAGIKVLEITLRTPAALEAMAAMAKALPECLIGAGTVRHGGQFKQVRNAGARFAVSPGASVKLLEAAVWSGLPFLPGVGSVSEAMTAQEHGFSVLKLFPAEAIGGVKLLKSIQAPLPDLKFCPTGGVSAANARSYLDLPNVIAIGGSWMVPENLVAEGKWSEIGALAKEAVVAVC